MKDKWLLAPLLAGAIMASAYVYSQPAGVPGLYLTSPTGSEQINVLGLGPQIETINVRQVRDSVGYLKSAATSGTVTFGANTSQIQLSDATTISTLTIALTAAPADGQVNCWYNKSAISTLTMTATSPQTLNDVLTSTSATTRYCYLYSLSNTTWDRIQ